MAKQDTNPFRTSMVRMRAPEGGGNCISVAGFTMFADEDGAFEVPSSIAKDLRDHGFTEAPPVVVKEAVKEPAKKEEGKG